MKRKITFWCPSGLNYPKDKRLEIGFILLIVVFWLPFVARADAFSVKNEIYISSTKFGYNIFKPESHLKDHSIKGVVTDIMGQPLVGVTIAIEGMQHGTTSDVNGQYFLDEVPDDGILVFTYVGYEIMRVSVEGRVEINVTLILSQNKLDEVLVVGYGTQRKINLTGAITQVSGKELENRMTPNLISGLQGVVPNFNISYGDKGGEPGSSPSYNLRGPGSLSGGSPFVLVDGVPQDLNSVNSNDIESISVLKDASASAIYGVRAAYGVILITTKKGKEGAKPTVTFNSRIGIQTPTKLPEIVDGLQFATMVNDAFANAGQAAKYSPEVIEMIKEEIKNPGKIPSTVPNPANPNEWDASQLHGNTNAYREFYKKATLNKDYNLSVSGGSNTINYFLSGGLFDQGSQYRYGDEYYKRYTLTSNISSQVTKWLKVGLNSKYIKRKYQMPHVYPLTGDFYHDIPRRWPIYPVYDANGHFYINTMALMADGGRKLTDEDQLFNSFLFQFDLTKSWKINADFNYSREGTKISDHAKTIYMYKVDNTPAPQAYSVPNGYTYESLTNNYTSTNIYSSYELNLSDHFVKVMAGFQSELNRNEGISVTKSDLVTDGVPFITTATGNPTINGSKGHWGTVGFFGRLNYNFEETYLFELSSRYDGTSRFQKGRRWGLFPSVSAGYNLAKESFWKEVSKSISMMKIRASYGTLGNQSVGGLYPYLSNMHINTNLNWVMGTERPLYVTAPGLVSPELTWETTTTFNIGADMEALNNRLSFTLDWFKRTTDNMFGPLESYPAVLGVNPPRRNNASMETKGFEATVGWRDKIGGLGYYLRINISDNISKITKYQNNTGTLTDYYEGKTLGEFWGYKTVGLFQTEEQIKKAADQSFIGSTWTPGNVQYADLNGDGKVDRGLYTLNDHGDYTILGNNLPRYSYSTAFGIDWQGFDLNGLLEGVGRRDVWLGGNFLFGDNGNFNQITIFKPHLDYWRPDNPNAYFPKPYMTSQRSQDIQVQSRYVQSAAYLRLKNVQVGYNLPSAVAEKILCNSVRIYFNGENLLTFTKMIDVFDPEVLSGNYGAGKTYPIATTYSFGIYLTLK